MDIYVVTKLIKSSKIRMTTQKRLAKSMKNSYHNIEFVVPSRTIYSERGETMLAGGVLLFLFFDDYEMLHDNEEKIKEKSCCKKQQSKVATK